MSTDKFTCSHCGEEATPYFSLNQWNWYVWFSSEKGCLVAEPSDSEEDRYRFSKLEREGLLGKEQEEASRILGERALYGLFDCSSCGNEDCVKISPGVNP